MVTHSLSIFRQFINSIDSFIVCDSCSLKFDFSLIHRFYWFIHRTRSLVLEIIVLFSFIYALYSFLCSHSFLSTIQNIYCWIHPVFIDDLDWSVQSLKVLTLLLWNLNVIDYWARERPVRTLGGIGPSVSLLQGFPNVGQFHDCLEVGFSGNWSMARSRPCSLIPSKCRGLRT